MSDGDSDGTGNAPSIAGSIAAVRAYKSLGPAVLEKGFLALCFCAVLLEKSRQRQAGLELDWVTCHELAPSAVYNIRIYHNGGSVAD
jgi:hypothetical protein